MKGGFNGSGYDLPTTRSEKGCAIVFLMLAIISIGVLIWAGLNE